MDICVWRCVEGMLMGMEVRDWIGVDGQLDVKDRMEMCVDGGEIG